MTEDIFGGGSGGDTASMVTVNAPDVTMDSIFEQSVNMDDVKKVEAAGLKPVGTYVTVPALALTPERQKEGKTPGRLVFRYFGPAVLTLDERQAKALTAAAQKLNPVAEPYIVGQEIKGSFGFRLSPEVHYKNDGTPDLASKLWGQGVRAFEVAAKRKPVTLGEVACFLRDYPTKVRVIQMGVGEDAQGEPGNLVVSISAVRE